MEGVLRTAKSLSVRVHRMESVTSDDSSERIVAAVSERIKIDPSINGIISASATAAMASVVAVDQSGRQIGREIDLTAKEAIPFRKSFRNGILPVFEDFLKAGDHLAKLFLSLSTTRICRPFRNWMFLK